jgi:hypothetical protein
MKNFIYLATIITTVITLFAAKSVQAQGVFLPPFPSPDDSSTTIYAPPLPEAAGYANGPTTPMIVVPVPPNMYPNNNYFPGSNTFGGNGYRSRRYPQPTLYPRAIQSACSTSIMGSPIPSPIAVNQSGMPCR